MAASTRSGTTEGPGMARYSRPNLRVIAVWCLWLSPVRGRRCCHRRQSASACPAGICRAWAIACIKACRKRDFPINAGQAEQGRGIGQRSRDEDCGCDRGYSNGSKSVSVAGASLSAMTYPCRAPGAAPAGITWLQTTDSCASGGTISTAFQTGCTAPTSRTRRRLNGGRRGESGRF